MAVTMCDMIVNQPSSNYKKSKIVQFPLYFLEFPLFFQCALGPMKIITKSNETLGICYLYIC